jgi:ribA/ribD-fused uncharacterized protein
LGAKSPFSHFYLVEIDLNGVKWNCAEQSYQTAHAECAGNKDVAYQMKFMPDGPSQKRLSKQIRDNRPDWWEKAKFQIMRRIDFDKFDQNLTLRSRLLATGDIKLVENNYNDHFFGMGNGNKWHRRLNNGGKILMLIRDYMNGDVRALPQVIVIGDSLARHVNKDALSKALDKHVEVLSFSGANFAFISRLACYITGKFVEKVIIVAGTCNLSSKSGYPREGPWHLIRKVKAFEKRFRRVCPTTELYLPYVLNRIDANSRISSHILRFNWQLINLRNEGTLGPNTTVVPIDPLPANCFADDGLHLNRRGSKHFSQLFCEQMATNE